MMFLEACAQKASQGVDVVVVVVDVVAVVVVGKDVTC